MRKVPMGSWRVRSLLGVWPSLGDEVWPSLSDGVGEVMESVSKMERPQWWIRQSNSRRQNYMMCRNCRGITCKWLFGPSQCHCMQVHVMCAYLYTVYVLIFVVYKFSL